MSAVSYHLCHLNIGKAAAPLLDPKMASFVENLERINNLAYQSPGFVWHLQIDIYNPEHLAMYGEPGVIFNLSVWESIESLYTYVYRSQHAEMMKFRKSWFAEMEGPHYVLWWLPTGELPTLEDGKKRIAHLADHGPTAHAFTFKDSFSNPTAIGKEDLPGQALLLPRSSTSISLEQKAGRTL
jgi:hypothetical protein